MLDRVGSDIRLTLSHGMLHYIKVEPTTTIGGLNTGASHFSTIMKRLASITPISLSHTPLVASFPGGDLSPDVHGRHIVQENQLSPIREPDRYPSNGCFAPYSIP